MTSIERHTKKLQWGSELLVFESLVYPECPYAEQRKDLKSDCRCRHKNAPGLYCGTMNIQKEGYQDCPFGTQDESS